MNRRYLSGVTMMFVALLLTGCKLGMFPMFQSTGEPRGSQSGLIDITDPEPEETRGQPQVLGHFFQQKQTRILCGIAAVNALLGYPAYTPKTAQETLEKNPDLTWHGTGQLLNDQVAYLLGALFKPDEISVISMSPVASAGKQDLSTLISNRNDLSYFFPSGETPNGFILQKSTRTIIGGHSSSSGHFVTLRYDVNGNLVLIDSILPKQAIVDETAPLFEPGADSEPGVDSEPEADSEQWTLTFIYNREHADGLLDHLNRMRLTAFKHKW